MGERMAETATYTCELCGEEFDSDTTDEEALSESRAFFGDVPPEELAVVCDPCWKKIHPLRN